MKLSPTVAPLSELTVFKTFMPCLRLHHTVDGFSWNCSMRALARRSIG